MSHDELMLDLRTHEDLCQRIEELATSYVPEWRLDKNDPDIGSVLALIYSGQMSENIRRFNQLPEKYHTEFINLLGMTLKPAYPASGVVVVEPARGTVPGVALPRGTHLMSGGEDGTPILFETLGDVYITNARITDILSISGTKGRIIPIIGGPSPASIIPEKDTAEHPDKINFSLFDYEEEGIEKNAFIIYHKNAFGEDPDIPVYVKFYSDSGMNVTKLLADSEKFKWSYFGNGRLCEFESVAYEDDFLVLSRGETSEKINTEGDSYHMICVEARDIVKGTVSVNDIRVASGQLPKAPGLILHNGEELEAGECLPFGTRASLFDECYICDERVFSQEDATICLSFSLASRRKVFELSVQQEQEQLKVIKRKPRTIQFTTARSSTQRIAIEYYNGSIWKRLQQSQSFETLFDGTHEGDYRITFKCPDDWKSVPINGYEGKCLRFRVTQADDCYLLPCEHTMPVMKNVCLSYEYENEWQKPQVVKTICGTQTNNNTKEIAEERTVALFSTLPYPEAALYLGFDRPLEGTPISVLFEVEENVPFNMEEVTFEYSARNGFKPMKVIDGTDNFSRSGTVVFMPPSDFAPVEIEGIRRYWLLLRGKKSAIDGYHTPIKNILLNAVDIKNQQTRAEETFYVDTTVPNMSFPLAARNILSAEVFVNEFGEHSRHKMLEMIEKSPELVRAGYDSLGEINEFFVRWEEVENFDRSEPRDRHYVIDRANNTLVFGDGVHVRIPQAKQDTAITVRPVSCDGAKGNVSVGEINSFFGNVMYVENVYNPVPTYAGSNIEDLESAKRRGADIISGRNRLISGQDFVRAVKAFSGTIEKVKCMAGVDIEGNVDPSLITIAIMTSDYADGAYSFNNIREPLRKKLLERCDATVELDNLIISEPMYVEISVSVWVKANEATRAFDTRNLILDSISEFFEPMSRPGHSGWEIGNLPYEAQLDMLLRSLQFDGRISRIIASGKFSDRTGTHEVSLDRLPRSPFAIAVNGEHNVYIEFE